MIQIDMKMPKHCVDCPFSIDNCCLVLGKYISLKQWAKGGIQKWCPLKEQEAIKPVLDEQTGRLWLCGKCGTYVGFEDNDPNDPNEFDKYCRECGRPVLWEGR